MRTYEFVCSNNPEHYFERRTPNGWCDRCDMANRPLLVPLDDPIPVPEPSESTIDEQIPETNRESMPDPTDAPTERGDEINNSDGQDVPENHPGDEPDSGNPDENTEIGSEDGITIDGSRHEENEQVPTPDPLPQPLIVLGDQEWLQPFLSKTALNNGETLFHAQSPADWNYAQDHHIAAYCLPAVESGAKGEALLYNHFAVTHPSGLAPEGFRIPSHQDIETLKKNQTPQFLDSHLTKTSGKTLFHRLAFGSFVEASRNRIFWTNTPNLRYTAKAYSVNVNTHEIALHSYDRHAAFFVRCLKITEE